MQDLTIGFFINNFVIQHTINSDNLWIIFDGVIEFLITIGFITILIIAFICHWVDEMEKNGISCKAKDEDDYPDFADEIIENTKSKKPKKKIDIPKKLLTKKELDRIKNNR